MPRQPEIAKIQSVSDHLVNLQIALCDVLDGPPNKLRADSVVLLRALETYYQRHIYPRLATRG